MTKMPDRPAIDEDHADQSNAARMIKIGICAAIYLAAILAMIGNENSAFGDLAISTELPLVLGSAVAMLVVTALWLKALGLSPQNDEPVAPKIKKGRRVQVLSGVFGGVIAILFFAGAIASGENIGEVTLFSNSPIPPMLAIGSAALFSVGIFYAGYQWHKNSDEHERAAVNTGLYAAFYFYAIATPSWWLLQRANIVPDQDPMIMFIFVLVIFSAVWTYKRGE